ncbi:energy-coupling factor transporter transmembrane protein EcfT [Microbacterium sp. NPDC076768]|uniref:energy-coupling factor transporter transmembrane component T family protein n=1 Tax=Microbacterium sp. NPDC076768 TaxID=3154858 RepID=UPI0034334A96
MIVLYRQGTGVFHRMSAGVKLATLAITVLAVSLFARDPVSVALVLFLVVPLYWVGRLPWQTPFEQVWRLRWLVVVLAGALLIFVSPAAAWTNTGRVVAVLLLASLLTLTTRMSEILSVLSRLLQPLRRIGHSPESVALAVSLAVTMIPVIAGFSDRVRQAQSARGVRLGMKAVVPLLVLALRHADEVGDALAARGLD